MGNRRPGSRKASSLVLHAGLRDPRKQSQGARKDRRHEDEQAARPKSILERGCAETHQPACDDLQEECVAEIAVRVRRVAQRANGWRVRNGESRAAECDAGQQGCEVVRPCREQIAERRDHESAKDQAAPRIPAHPHHGHRHQGDRAAQDGCGHESELPRIWRDGERHRPDQVWHQHGGQQTDTRQQRGGHDTGEPVHLRALSRHLRSPLEDVRSNPTCYN